MKISSIDVVNSYAEQISFVISDHPGAIFRICSQWGTTCYFKANSTEQEIPIIDNINFINNSIHVTVDNQNVKVNNPNKQNLNIVLEIYEDNSPNIHEIKYLALYDLQVIRYVTSQGNTASLDIQSASVVGNNVTFSTQLEPGTYEVYSVNVDGHLYDVSASLEVTEGDTANTGKINKFVTVYQ